MRARVGWTRPAEQVSTSQPCPARRRPIWRLEWHVIARKQIKLLVSPARTSSLFLDQNCPTPHAPWECGTLAPSYRLPRPKTQSPTLRVKSRPRDFLLTKV